MKEVLVPDIGDFKDVEVIEVLVKPGDAIDKEQSLITLESDKATMEIPSPTAGVVKELKVKVGDKISQGTPILMVEEQGSAASAPKPEPEKQEKEREKERVKEDEEAMLRGIEMSLADGLALESELGRRVNSSKDFAEGMKAFAEKRKPNYTGE